MEYCQTNINANKAYVRLIEWLSGLEPMKSIAGIKRSMELSFTSKRDLCPARASPCQS